MTNRTDALPTTGDVDADIPYVPSAGEALKLLEEMDPNIKKIRAPKRGSESEDEYRQVQLERTRLSQGSLREENIRAEIGALKERFNDCTRIWQD